MKILTTTDYKNFIDNLVLNAPKIDSDNLQRQKNISCSNYILLGYSIPQCRKIAKEILKDGFEGMLKYYENKYYEEVLIRGLVLSGIKDRKKFFDNIMEYIPFIDSWSICDCVITNFYIFKKETTLDDFNFFCNLALSDKEFFARFGIMMIFKYCLNENNLAQIFKLMLKITNHKYYVDMAISWLLCECMIKFESQTFDLIKQKKFTKFIQNKTISKCRDSFRISSNLKEDLKNYRI